MPRTIEELMAPGKLWKHPYFGVVLRVTGAYEGNLNYCWVETANTGHPMKGVASIGLMEPAPDEAVPEPEMNVIGKPPEAAELQTYEPFDWLRHFVSCLEPGVEVTFYRHPTPSPKPDTDEEDGQ